MPLALIAALRVGRSIPALTAPLIGIAAILVIVFVPLWTIAREEEE